MAERAFTDDAEGLLARIYELVDQGHIRTWKYNREGYFTHTPSDGQWTQKAWFWPEAESDKLRFLIVRAKGVSLTREVYAVYHGRFIEMLIAHVPEYFTGASATPNPGEREPPVEE